jgi:hypothetical protein
MFDWAPRDPDTQARELLFGATPADGMCSDLLGVSRDARVVPALMRR